MNIKIIIISAIRLKKIRSILCSKINVLNCNQFISKTVDFYVENNEERKKTQLIFIIILP